MVLKAQETRGYDHTPVIGATNLCIESNTIATMLRDDMEYCVIGAHTASPTSGDSGAERILCEKRGTQALEMRYDRREFSFKTGGRWHRKRGI